MNRSVDPKKVNSELFTLTYGALVVQLLNDLESVEEVNKQLDRMGYNIGVRLVEDFIARTSADKCYDLRETADKIQAGFRLYLGVSPSVGGWGPAGDEFSLTLDSNPLAEFVELPETCSNMRYSAILPGIVRGACEMVHLEVTSWFVQDQLRGDPVTELRVKFVKRLEDSVPPGED
ncbi:trafficking protein particle complex subunit 3-like [Pollicipes pollicipes]|uniref:trafficking protein particle complex subunit 3-like n=1 Tax=Pollicipes pollicipes TaxID=41117 RepID=UPI0018849837|nr:trafficking protein particle complex subunit 3-like [Pollicipes pollicipes]XP_037083084.1 trafficking protein particle complex subunit 3-like [Pollicipes pollicipes]XP_037083085.1 trafficking protein particle complex subunit 3-like [Pollicipes pollicipes]XP_037083086.1 trafficking protein particle complex subunit 3-like [Pollicipes pollicipes]